MIPPSDVHGPHVVPSKCRVHNASSSPRTYTSSVPAPSDVAPGPSPTRRSAGGGGGGGGGGVVPRTAPEPVLIMRPDSSTASKSEPCTLRSIWSTSLFQRSSGTPDMNHGDPLSATII